MLVRCNLMALKDTMVRLGTETHARLYRALGGKGVGGGDGPGSVIVVTATGRKSGKARSKPLVYLRDDSGDYVVAGSANGDDRHPAWIHNMEANPNVTVQDRDRIIECTATIEWEGETRDSLWAKFEAMDDRFADYATRTDRTIPVAVLAPKAR